MVDLVVLDRLLRATSKKRSSTFFEKKVHPRQNPGYAYDRGKEGATGHVSSSDLAPHFTYMRRRRRPERRFVGR